MTLPLLLKTLLGCIAFLIGLGCTVFILVEAFRDEIWKGIVGFLCFLYLLYFMLFDWEHEWKWVIVLCALGGDAIAAGIMRM